jgi:hypothetical protein
MFSYPKDVIDRFDFTVCMGAYVPAWRKDFIFGKDFLVDLSQRVLRYNPGEYPIASLWRAKKFLKRDFKLPAVELIYECILCSMCHPSRGKRYEPGNAGD